MAYGWSDSQIFDMIERRGFEWLEESVKYIMEDKRNHYISLLQMFPVARSPMDSKSGKAIQKYYKEVAESFDSITPWMKQTKRRLVSKAIRGKQIEPGKLVVDLAGDGFAAAFFNEKNVETLD